jgi:hypothetical protein
MDYRRERRSLLPTATFGETIYGDSADRYIASWASRLVMRWIPGTLQLFKNLMRTGNEFPLYFIG